MLLSAAPFLSLVVAVSVIAADSYDISIHMPGVLPSEVCVVLAFVLK